MALVRLMPLAAFELPSVVGREESVGLGRRVGNLGQTQTVCHSHRLLIHTRTTNDVDIEKMDSYGQMCTACAKQCYNLIKSNFDLPAR